MIISERNKIVFAAILMPTFFGFSFLASKVGLNVLNNNPIDLISFRFLFAAITMYILKKFGLIIINLEGKDIKTVLMLSMFYPILSFIFEAIGISMTTSVESGVLLSLYPILTTIMAILILKEYPNKIQVIFILLSTLGVFFMNYMQRESGHNIIGYIILIVAAIFSSFHGALSRKASLNFKPQEITYIMIFMGAIVFNSISISKHLIEGDLLQYFSPLMNSRFLFSVLYLAVGCSVIGFFLLNYLYSKLEASRISVLANIATIISIAAGVIILKEIVYWYHYVGAATILCGAWGTNYFNKKG